MLEYGTSPTRVLVVYPRVCTCVSNDAGMIPLRGFLVVSFVGLSTCLFCLVAKVTEQSIATTSLPLRNCDAKTHRILSTDPKESPNCYFLKTVFKNVFFFSSLKRTLHYPRKANASLESGNFKLEAKKWTKKYKRFEQSLRSKIIGGANLKKKKNLF